MGQQNWGSNLTVKISHVLTYFWLFSVKIPFWPIWTKIPNKDHFFHLKNLNCHNPGSDCEKWHFSGLTEAFLVIFMSYLANFDQLSKIVHYTGMLSMLLFWIVIKFHIRQSLIVVHSSTES